MNTGVIPRVDPIAQYRIQDVNVNSFFAIGRFESKGRILDYQLHLMLLAQERGKLPQTIYVPAGDGHHLSKAVEARTMIDLLEVTYTAIEA